MNRKYIYLVLALTFFSFLLILGYFIRSKPDLVAQDVPVETPPFLTYISGSGVVEPASGNILISAPFNRLIEKINVSINENVKKGQVLFQLSHQDLKAELKVKQKKLEESLSQVAKLKALPRQEDLTVATESLKKAQALFNSAATEYCAVQKRARSQEEKCLSLYKYQQAEAEFLIAGAEFEKVRSGVWLPELKMAQDVVEQAKADVGLLETEIERMSVKSPIDGTILQIKIHEGEVLDPNKTALILGNIGELNLRVGIDQFNGKRFQPDCPAVAFKQGDITLEFPLKFLHVEPLMVPKKYLTNEIHEKVDTQIFEILYRIEKNPSQLFIGEQMDVYIYVEKSPAADQK